MGAQKGGDIADFINSATEKLNEGNYNEMDGLVFAQLSYSKFESSEMQWNRSELENGVTVQKLAQKLLESQHITPSTPTEDLSDEQMFLKALLNSERYKDCTVTDLTACNEHNMWDAGRCSVLQDDAQWAAMTIHMNDGSDASIVSIRGTNESQFGWQEDIELLYEPDGTTAQKLSRDYLSSVNSDHIYMTGHSKGGNNASSGYMMSDKSVRDRVVQINNYDGPGNNPELNDNYPDGYSELFSKQKNYYPEGSIVGQLLADPPGEMNYVNVATLENHTEIAVLGEHDPFSWDVKDGSLLLTQQSELSRMINRALDSSLDGLSSGEKATAMQALINIGVPHMLSEKKLELPDWNDLIFKVLQHPFRSLQEMWMTLRVVRNLLFELSQYGVIRCIDFMIPGVEDFIYWVKGFFSDAFRQFKDAMEDLWNAFWSGITGGGSEDDSQHREDRTPVYDFDDEDQGTYADNISDTRVFMADPDALKIQSRNIMDCAGNIGDDIRNLLDVKNSMSGIGRILAEIPFDVLILNARKSQQQVNSFGKTLITVADRYISAETEIVSNITPASDY